MSRVVEVLWWGGHPDIRIVRNFIYHASQDTSVPIKTGINVHQPATELRSVHIWGTTSSIRWEMPYRHQIRIDRNMVAFDIF